MSGVCAIIARRQADGDESALTSMIAAAPHRGTGGVARYIEAGAALAQLSCSAETRDPAGPVVDPVTGSVVVADARIDNGQELHAAIGSASPSSNDDAATVIAAVYRRWGVDGIDRLIGDFAFALWDPSRRRLVLARDPMAMRALYYRAEPGRVLVATEVAQLLAVPGVPDQPDERMVAAYLSGCFGSLDWTWYAGITQVAPGHVVVVDDARVRTWRYWDVDPEREIVHGSEQEYAEELRALFLDAVRARMRGGRPTGVLLSGGIDSGAAAAAAGWLREQDSGLPPVHSYSFDYGSLRQCDERHISRHIVERYSLQAIDVPAEDAGPLAGYPLHAPDLDDSFHGHFQPLLDRTLAQARRDGVGPLFTGMRGDLAIGPIDEDYATLLRRRRWRALVDELRRHAAVDQQPLRAVARRNLLPIIARVARRRTVVMWARRLVARGEDPRVAVGEGLPPWISPALAQRVDLPSIVATYTNAATPPLRSVLRRRRYQWVFMPMHLRWATSHERRAAQFGLEAVDAWSDRRIAEFSVALPQHILERPGIVEKQLARVAMTGVMPDEFRRRAGKTLPTPLYEQTLRTTAVPAVRTLLTDSRADAAGWLDAQCLLDHYERFVAGAPAPGALWWALSLEWWLRVRKRQPIDIER